MAKGKCITTKIEMVQHVLPLAKEYQDLYPELTQEAAWNMAWEDVYEEMQQQTIAFKINHIFNKQV